MPPWEKVKGICQPCRDLLCDDKPFSCEKAHVIQLWMCESCHQSGDKSIIGERVEKLSECRFPWKPSKREKDAFTAFATVHGRNARRSDGGHLAAARRKQEEGAANSPHREEEAKAAPSLIVKLMIGKERAAQHEKWNSNIVPDLIHQTGEWKSIVNRPPTPPESIVGQQDAFVGSSGPSPSKSSFPVSPSTAFRPELASSIPVSRRGSEQSRLSVRESFNTDGADDEISFISDTRKKKKRLHRGLKERKSDLERIVSENLEPQFRGLKRDATFHTNEDLLAKFKHTVERRQSDDQSITEKLRNVEKNDPPRIPGVIHSSDQEPAVLIEQPEPVKALTPSSNNTKVENPDPKSLNVVANSEIECQHFSNVNIEHVLPQFTQNRPVETQESDLAPPPAAEIIDLMDDDAPKAEVLPKECSSGEPPQSENLVHDTKQLEDGVLNSHTMVMDAAVRQTEGEQRSPHLNETTFETTPTQSVPQLKHAEVLQHTHELESAGSADQAPAVESDAKQVQPSKEITLQAAMPTVDEQTLEAVRTAPTEHVPRGLKLIMGPSVGKNQRASLDMELTNDLSPSHSVEPFRYPLPESGVTRSISPKKRPFPGADYLDQMVEHAKKSKNESQAPEPSYQNAFTPINHPAHPHFKSLSSQSLNERQEKPPKQKRRRPKSQNLADLRKLAPAPFLAEQTQESGPARTTLGITQLISEQNGHQDFKEPTESRISPAPPKQDISGKLEARIHSYPFLNRRRSQQGRSSKEPTASPPSLKAHLTPPTMHRSPQLPFSSPFQRQNAIAHGASPKHKPAPQGLKFGPAPLPSPAESDAHLRPDLDHNDIFSLYPQQNHPSSFGHPSKHLTDTNILRRHSTQMERPRDAPPRPIMQTLNQPLPSQIVASGPYHGSSIARQVPAPSQIYSAPMTPTEQFHSPNRASFPQFPPNQTQRLPPFSGHSRSDSGQSSFDNGALRHFIEQTKLHIYPPSNETSKDRDFEIVRLGPYSSADNFVSTVLNEVPGHAMKVAKLRVAFTWMQEGNRGRTLAMRLDNPERKEDAFKHVCEEISGQFRIGGMGAPVTLDVDVVLKEGAK